MGIKSTRDVPMQKFWNIMQNRLTTPPGPQHLQHPRRRSWAAPHRGSRQQAGQGQRCSQADRAHARRSGAGCRFEPAGPRRNSAGSRSRWARSRARCPACGSRCPRRRARGRGRRGRSPRPGGGARRGVPTAGAGRRAQIRNHNRRCITCSRTAWHRGTSRDIDARIRHKRTIRTADAARAPNWPTRHPHRRMWHRGASRGNAADGVAEPY